MAYKDEYEVARLYTASNFAARLAGQFAGNYRFHFHLAQPILSGGKPAKRKFGPWMWRLFAVLAKLKGLRGTAFDVFGYTEERRMERALIAEYEAPVGDLVAALSPDRYETATALAALPDGVRGYGHVKANNERLYRARLAELKQQMERRAAT